MYQRYLANVNQLEDQFAALWTQCQRCQVIMQVFCHGSDIPSKRRNLSAYYCSALLLVWRVAARAGHALPRCLASVLSHKVASAAE